MKKITKLEAQRLNQNWYYTGNPCKNGHDSTRYVNGGKCSECVKSRATKYRIDNAAKIVEYQKEYRKNNKIHIQNKQREYRQNNTEKIREKDKRYYLNNKERIRRSNNNYVEKNKDKLQEYQRKWRDDNREYKKATDLRYKQENREYLNKYSKDYYLNNREEINIKEKLRYQENIEEKLKYANEYRNKNTDLVNRRNREYRKQEHVKERRRKRDAYLRKHCPKTITMGKCRELLKRTLKVIKEDKTDSTYTLLGYKPADLREHVEKYMIDGMTWENFGEYWCLDHRNPVSRLVQQGITEPSVINRLDNLRPLLVSHNLSKSSKTEEEYFGDNPDIRDMYPYMINPLA